LGIDSNKIVFYGLVKEFSGFQICNEMLAQWVRGICGKLFDPFLRLGGIQNSFLLANQREDLRKLGMLYLG
jgi:hypothetical protein